MFLALKETPVPSGRVLTIRILGDDADCQGSAAIRNLASPSDLWKIIAGFGKALKGADNLDRNQELSFPEA